LWSIIVNKDPEQTLFKNQHTSKMQERKREKINPQNSLRPPWLASRCLQKCVTSLSNPDPQSLVIVYLVCLLDCLKPKERWCCKHWFSPSTIPSPPRFAVLFAISVLLYCSRTIVVGVCSIFLCSRYFIVLIVCCFF